MKTVYLGLGSSIGDKEGIITSALAEIEKWGSNFSVSSFFYSKPWGGVAKNMFLNVVCSIDVVDTLSSDALLDMAQLLEKKFLRTRTLRWEDRTLDIDILLYGDEKVCTNRLVIPHPYILERDFVYIPLLEVFSRCDTKESLRMYLEFVESGVEYGM